MSDDSRVLAKAPRISLVKMPSSDEGLSGWEISGTRESTRIGSRICSVVSIMNCLTARIEIRNKSHALGHELLLYRQLKLHKRGNWRIRVGRGVGSIW